jgi:hypothetical protein
MTTPSSKDQFNANADRYAVSEVHRAGPSLPVLLKLARPVGDSVSGTDAGGAIGARQ